MMHKIAIALAAAVMATGGLMSVASARGGGGGGGMHGSFGMRGGGYGQHHDGFRGRGYGYRYSSPVPRYNPLAGRGPIYQKGTIPPHWWQTRNPYYHPWRTSNAGRGIGLGGPVVHGPPYGYHWSIRNPYYHPWHPWTRTGRGGVYGSASIARPRGSFRRR